MTDAINIQQNKQLLRAEELLKSRVVYESVLDLMNEPHSRHEEVLDTLNYTVLDGDTVDAAIAQEQRDCREMRVLLRNEAVREQIASKIFENCPISYLMDKEAAQNSIEVSLGLREPIISDEPLLPWEEKAIQSEQEALQKKQNSEFPSEPRRPQFIQTQAPAEGIKGIIQKLLPGRSNESN